MALTDREQAILDFERCWWQQPGTKVDAIRDQLGVSPTRYYELLSALVLRPDALEYDPLLVRRMRRDRVRRRRGRFESRFAGGPRS